MHPTCAGSSGMCPARAPGRYHHLMPDAHEEGTVDRVSDQWAYEQSQAAITVATTSTSAPWEFEVRSRTLTRWAWIAAVIVFAIHIFMAIVVRVGYTGAAVTTIDQWSFVGMGFVWSGVCLLALRPMVKANCDGVLVRNFLGSQFYPWELIHGLSFPKGSKCARLELPDFEFVALWAMHVGDGDRVVKAVNDFRLLEDKYLPED